MVTDDPRVICKALTKRCDAVKMYLKSVLMMSYKGFTLGSDNKMNHLSFRDAVRDAMKKVKDDTDKKGSDAMDH